METPEAAAVSQPAPPPVAAETVGAEAPTEEQEQQPEQPAEKDQEEPPEPQAAADDQVEERDGTDYLKVPLTDAEKLEIADKLVRLHKQRGEQEDRLASVTGELKGAIKHTAEDSNKAFGRLRDGYDMRKVKVKIVRDYRVGEVRKVRLDTGEIYETRAMSIEERQRAFDLKEKKKTEANGEAAPAAAGVAGETAPTDTPAADAPAVVDANAPAADDTGVAVGPE